MTEIPVPENLKAQMEATRSELLERLVEIDEHMGELFLEEKVPTVDDIKAAVRRSVINNTLVPVFLGSAYKNKGVQLLLDGVTDYLPNPSEKQAVAMDRNNGEAEGESANMVGSSRARTQRRGAAAHGHDDRLH